MKILKSMLGDCILRKPWRETVSIKCETKNVGNRLGFDEAWKKVVCHSLLENNRDTEVSDGREYTGLKTTLVCASISLEAE